MQTITSMVGMVDALAGVEKQVAIAAVMMTRSWRQLKVEDHLNHD